MEFGCWSHVVSVVGSSRGEPVRRSRLGALRCPGPASDVLTHPGAIGSRSTSPRTIIEGFEAAGILRSEEMSGAGIAFLVRGGEDACAVCFENHLAP